MTSSTTASAGRAIKIAIIEDDQAISQMYRFKFEAENFDVNTAENGRLGLELIEKMRPDIIPDSIKSQDVSAVILKSDMTPRQVAELVKKTLEAA